MDYRALPEDKMCDDELDLFDNPWAYLCNEAQEYFKTKKIELVIDESKYVCLQCRKWGAGDCSEGYTKSQCVSMDF
jgi:predicted SprT family Zn-dependent metalloprotease